MEYRTFGRSGVRVSRLCMGTMTFGGQADEQQSRRMVDMCLDAGINFFDTANIYNDGESERILGRILKGRRDDLVVASKVRYPTGDGPNDEGLSRVHIRRAIDATLERLQMDYVDLYQAHQPDYETPIDVTLDAMDELVRDGRVRYGGVSNFAAWQVCEAMHVAERRSVAAPVSVQPMYNMLMREVETELLPMCRAYNLATMAYNPLAGGLLTGKHERGTPEAGTRFGLLKSYRDRYWHDRYFDAIENLKTVASEAGIAMVEMSLRWLLGRENLTCIILGASRPEQLEQNLAACENGALPADVQDACDEAWQQLRGPMFSYVR
jgi:aryl-alcohol dehydrogenase-like predicted oxidoreductase